MTDSDEAGAPRTPPSDADVTRRKQVESDESDYSHDLADVDDVDDADRFGSRSQRRQWKAVEAKRLMKARVGKMNSNAKKAMESSPSRVGGSRRRARMDGAALASRATKRAARADEDQLRKDIEAKPCGCKTCNHFAAIPFHVLAHHRKEYAQMNTQQRKHKVFYHCLRMYERERGRRAAR
jgi:hypothetical protein